MGFRGVSGGHANHRGHDPALSRDRASARRDVKVKRPIGESYGPRDSQVDSAIEVLVASPGTGSRD